MVYVRLWLSSATDIAVLRVPTEYDLWVAGFFTVAMRWRKLTLIGKSATL
jgi:hypothetical protein